MVVRKRRALSHVGGRVETWGTDDRARMAAARSLAVDNDEEKTLAHVHGFHSYPARLHPETAARLIEDLSRARGIVLDPFCGSGTVLVEALRLGRGPIGVDANPIAYELGWLKTRRWNKDELEKLIEAARRAAAFAEERRLAKAGPTRRYFREDRELFDVHVLLELDGLSAGIRDLAAARTPRDTIRALMLVLSAILTKVSRQPGDTAGARVPRRLASGFAIRFFVKKAEELARRLGDFEALMPPRMMHVRLIRGDARRLAGVEPRSVDLVVTSPPYPGVYDYYEHHVTRLRWLELDAHELKSREIGSRRHARGRSFDELRDEWQRDFGDCLAEMGRVLRPGGAIALVIADSALAGRALRADEAIEHLARRVRLTVVARASQVRPHFHGPSVRVFRGRPRREHVLVLR